MAYRNLFSEVKRMTNPIPPRDHRISRQVADAMRARFRAVATRDESRQPPEGSLGGMISKDAIISLLSGPDVAYLRFYYGYNDKGGPEVVFYAADANGDDSGAEPMDIVYPCPPHCGGG